MRLLSLCRSLRSASGSSETRATRCAFSSPANRSKGAVFPRRVPAPPERGHQFSLRRSLCGRASVCLSVCLCALWLGAVETGKRREPIGVVGTDATTTDNVFLQIPTCFQLHRRYAARQRHDQKSAASYCNTLQQEPLIQRKPCRYVDSVELVMLFNNSLTFWEIHAF